MMTLTARHRTRYAQHFDRPDLRRVGIPASCQNLLSEHLLECAGLATGMRVLDVGCGNGELTLLAARLVGPRGRVLGVDRCPDAISRARSRAREAGVSNVAFRLAEAEQCTFAAPFDALVGRQFLAHTADPARVLRRLVRLVRPGGLLVVQEMNLARAAATPALPLARSLVGWLQTLCQRGGLTLDTATLLPAIFREAGLPNPHLQLSASGASPQEPRAYHEIVQTLAQLLPLLEHHGVTSARELRLNTLAARLHAEAEPSDGVLLAFPMAGAWARRELFLRP
jgi:2-polyprenyl-3-methyl-5-hydroxy-6-metoxy-1,4-benzoquinol methylase